VVTRPAMFVRALLMLATAGLASALMPAAPAAAHAGFPTFHFWSGATVSYQVTKSAGSVTGTPS